MMFADPSYFLLLIPAALLAWFYVIGRIGREAALRFSDVGIVKSAGGTTRRSGRVIPAILRFAAFACLIAAIARPQSGYGEDRSTREVVDIMVTLDVSGSMATLDFQPDNRLVAAKQEARRFIQGRPDDRIGLVIFGGQSFTQCPLTVDHQAILTLLDKIELGMVEDGTAIGLGLANAVNRLRNSEAKSKVVVLLTDGVNNAGEIDPLTAGDLAKTFGVRVYAIGVGRQGTSLLPIQDPRFGTRLLRVETQIDEPMLTAIAQKTGGEYFRAEDQRALRSIFDRINALERTKIKVERTTHYEEHYFWFAWPALLLLFSELAWTRVVRLKLP